VLAAAWLSLVCVLLHAVANAQQLAPVAMLLLAAAAVPLLAAAPQLRAVYARHASMLRAVLRVAATAVLLALATHGQLAAAVDVQAGAWLPMHTSGMGVAATLKPPTALCLASWTVFHALPFRQHAAVQALQLVVVLVMLAVRASLGALIALQACAWLAAPLAVSYAVEARMRARFIARNGSRCAAAVSKSA
jgi:hypothetical protein